ncbi:MAG TPA: hypothetical protein VJR93_00245, partial [Chthoniobacterales bacterium]|nr:hypothetical protein [Chthoniobacterales bacterium]
FLRVIWLQKKVRDREDAIGGHTRRVRNPTRWRAGRDNSSLLACACHATREHNRTPTLWLLRRAKLKILIR